MSKTLLLSFLSTIYVLTPVSANAEESTYRHYTFDTLIEEGATTPDALPYQAHARLSGQERQGRQLGACQPCEQSIVLLIEQRRGDFRKATTDDA